MKKDERRRQEREARRQEILKARPPSFAWSPDARSLEDLQREQGTVSVRHATQNGRGVVARLTRR